MEFIKSLWNKVKTFFGGLFTSKKVIAAVAKTEVPVNGPVAANEVAVQAEATEQAEAKAEKLAALFMRVVELAGQRNYALDEARAAVLAEDEATLVRIAAEMKAKKYKAPSKSKLKAQAKAAANLAAA